MDINVRNSLPTAQFGNESVETWLRDVYRRLEDLERRSLSPRVVGSAPSGGGGAGVHLPFVTIGNTPQLTAERALTHDASLSHVDGGPNSSYTLGVVDNGHRHIEENIDETKYLVVDTGGKGDFTTLSDALTYITTNGTNDDRWTVLVRSDLTENIDGWSAGASKADINVHIWSLGRTRINGWVRAGSYGVMHLHNFEINNTDNGTNATLRASNGNSIYAYDCILTRNEAIPTGPQGIVVDPSGGDVYLYRCLVRQISVALYPAIRFVNAGNVYAWDCEIIANGGGGRGGVTCNIEGGLHLYHCKIDNLSGDVIHIVAGDGEIEVWRCQYDTTRVSGTGSITILDGDVPPPDAGSITPAMIAPASAQFKYLVSGVAPYNYIESPGFLDIATGKTLAISESLTLTASAAGYTVTIPKSGTMPNGTGVVGRLTEWVTDVNTLQASTLAKTGAGVLTLTAANNSTLTTAIMSGKTLTLASADDYNLTIAGNSTINGSLVGNITGGGTIATGGFTATIPATDTVAMLNVANVFTQAQTITAPSTTALTGGLIFTQTKTGTAAGVYKFTDLTGTISPSSNPGGSQDYYLLSAIVQTAANATVYSGLNLRSFYLSPRHQGSGTASTLVGGYVDAYNLGTGTVTNGMGYYAIIRNAGSGAGKITAARMFWAANMVNSATASDNQYAFYADALTTATNNYLLYGAGLGRVRIGDDVSIVGGADRAQLTVLGHTTQAVGVAMVGISRNDTAAGISAMLALTAKGSAAIGDGGSIQMAGLSSVASRQMALMSWRYLSPTDASLTTQVDFTTYYSSAATANLNLSMASSSGGPLIGVLGAAPIARYSSTGDLRQALIDFGFVTTGGASPLDLNGGLFTAGSIAQSTLKSSGVHKSTSITYISGTGTAGADNTAQTVKTLTLAANTLTQVGDRLRIRAYWTGDTGSPITGSCLIGPAGSEVLVSHTTDSGGASLQLNEVWLHYIDNTHSNIIENEAGALGALSAVNVAGFTWNASQAIIFTQDAIVNNHTIVYALIVDIFPKGV